MIPNTFEAQLPIIFKYDDLKDDSAPGEQFATSFGITEYTWGDAINEGLVDNKPLSQATRDECISIIRANYYNRCRIGALPAGVGLMVFNDAVLCGSGHAVKLLQRVIGCAAIDGVAGPETLRRAGSYAGGVKGLIDALHDGDVAYFEELANAPKYFNGWLRRADEVRDKAYEMAAITLPA